MSRRLYSVYIMTNPRNTVLYTGVTGDLAKRIFEHKLKVVPGFTARYNVDKLVYHETFETPNEAILRERQIKGGSRVKKIILIESMNPEWKDLSDSI